MQDIAELTGSLVRTVRGLCPGATVAAGSARAPVSAEVGDADRRISVRLVAIEPLNGPRCSGAVASRLRLQYRFDFEFADAVEEHQALADIAFGLLAREDLHDGLSPVRGENASVLASFTVERRRELPTPKPVREAVFKLGQSARISGIVQAEGGLPLARARLEISDGDRLITTGADGAFAFNVPTDLAVRAKVTAKGTTAEVELKPGKANVITLAMEH